MPQRILLSRRRGWRKPAGAIVVARPSRWGNPHVVDATTTRAEAVTRFAASLAAGELAYSAADVAQELAGHDLACWCPLDEPCHADVLLAVAAAASADR